MVNFTEIGSVIQMAVAPAFLLTGLGAILTVMGNRLSRIVDRFRVLKEETIRKNAEINKELNSLLLRAKWTHWAIALTTISALFICLLIAMIFIATKVSFDLDHYLIILFIVAMTSLVFGLLCFLREVSLSKGVIKL
tara:strand:+ start:621 stop:1031 length:411 start_codon:yes stop_codon:yes gene_type:complete